MVEQSNPSVSNPGWFNLISLTNMEQVENPVNIHSLLWNCFAAHRVVRRLLSGKFWQSSSYAIAIQASEGGGRVKLLVRVGKGGLDTKRLKELVLGEIAAT